MAAAECQMLPGRYAGVEDILTLLATRSHTLFKNWDLSADETVNSKSWIVGTTVSVHEVLAVFLFYRSSCHLGIVSIPKRELFQTGKRQAKAGPIP